LFRYLDTIIKLRMTHTAIILSTLLNLLFIPFLNIHRETKMPKAFSITRLARDNL